MTLSRGAGLVDGPLQPDDQSHPTHEQSTPLGLQSILPPVEENEDEDESHSRQVSSWRGLPWWKRPSPYWLIVGAFIGASGYSALLAPKIAMYTDLACRVHRPEYVTNNFRSFASLLTRESLAARTAGVPVTHASNEDEIAVSNFPPDSTYITPLDDAQIRSEPDSQQKCASDPVVQAVVARLSAVFMTTMGVLSCLTSGWWGSLSDRSGRRVILLILGLGPFMTDIIHVITAWFVDILPGGYWFPLVGYLIEGLCGSMSARTAIAHAYIADTTEPSTRSRYFALQHGLLFAGGAIGPLLGGLLIRSTGDTLSVFYFAGILHGLHIIFILCVPESLTSARARGARLRRSQEKTSEASGGRILTVLKSVTRFLAPLIILLPRSSSDADLPRRNRKDWSLLLVAIAYGLDVSVIGSMSYTFQYAAAQFRWTLEKTSYFASIVGATRAIFLTAVLPIIIKYFKPSPIRLPITRDEPLQATTGSRPPRNASISSNLAQTIASDECIVVSQSAAFDLASARISVGLETVAFLGMAVASTGALFTLATAATSLGSGFHPVIQALSLDIYTNHHPQSRGEAGKLFGALGVIQALGSQIIGPAFYGFVYFNTVAVFPQAIMIVSMCTTLLAFTSVSFVRIPSKPIGDLPESEHENQEANQEVEAEVPENLVATEN